MKQWLSLSQGRHAWVRQIQQKRNPSSHGNVRWRRNVINVRTDGYLSKDCLSKKKSSSDYKDDGKSKRLWYNCSKAGHIANFCMKPVPKMEKTKELRWLPHPQQYQCVIVKKNVKWILDSGSVRHISIERNDFVTFTAKDGTVKVWNNAYINSRENGTMKLASVDFGQTHIIHLCGIMYACKLAYSLISLSPAWKKEFKIIIDEDKNEHQEGRMELVHQPSDSVRMIGNDTADGLYEM